MTPEQLVIELNECFMKFDEIIDRHGLEKIKTLGDGYMCAGGIPTPNVTNPVDIVLAGLEIQLYMNQFALERQKQNKLAWQVRLGIHSGELIAGVVGKKKFAYDIWGDTVNTASRMESSGEPAKVNISGTTYELVKDFFDCTYRGKIPAKNKGEISMYFVNCIKKELSVNGQGLVPNDKFKQLLAKYNDEMSKKYSVQPAKEAVS
jgi:class 3 adenylate cyclase